MKQYVEKVVTGNRITGSQQGTKGHKGWPWVGRARQLGLDPWAVLLDPRHFGFVWYLILPLMLWELSVAEQRCRAVLETVSRIAVTELAESGLALLLDLSSKH